MDERKGFKAQAAFEYLTTYAWVLIVAAFVGVVFLIFIALPQSEVQASCTISYGLTCEGISVGSALSNTVIDLVLMNSQAQDLIDPQASVSLQNYGVALTTCQPANVLSAGVIICTAKVSASIPVDTAINGGIIVKAFACLSGTAPDCQYTSNVIYTGNFTTYSNGYLGTVPTNIILYSSASSIAEGGSVTLTARAMVFGTPQRGASVQFYSNSINGKVSIPSGVSDSNGNVTTYFTSDVPGNYLVTAAFAGQQASNTIRVIP